VRRGRRSALRTNRWLRRRPRCDWFPSDRLANKPANVGRDLTSRALESRALELSRAATASRSRIPDSSVSRCSQATDFARNSDPPSFFCEASSRRPWCSPDDDQPPFQTDLRHSVLCKLTIRRNVLIVKSRSKRFRKEGEIFDGRGDSWSSEYLSRPTCAGAT